MIQNKVLQNLLYKSAYSRSFFTLYGVVLKEIRVAFSQFFTFKYPIRSLIRTIGIIFSSVNRLVLGRSLKYSFSFTGEDRIIEGILKPNIIQNGQYVDVGANHPTFLSNTYGLYRKGWRGICIDANSQLIKKYAYYRPKDKAVDVLVSDQEELRGFYMVQNNVLSTTKEFALEQYKQEGLEIKLKTLKTQTLTQILDEHQFPSGFELLSVDAEEHDFEVLQGLDWEKYQPKLVVVEDETFDSTRAEQNPIFCYMKEKGYALEGFVLKNLYFLKSA